MPATDFNRILGWNTYPPDAWDHNKDDIWLIYFIKSQNCKLHLTEFLIISKNLFNLLLTYAHNGGIIVMGIS